ncbi:hypothetical protein Ahy_A01g004125 isoform F [Arachis hypogaea]|uniref:Uncharacterized protein n=1 Tax=Arachis hypogaea TaxID=3818 RepID=A0A445EUW3_ARAHY|nr:hypothetical protein Ahy_A01g004125 isoform F [Arachis hypogaea]
MAYFSLLYLLHKLHRGMHDTLLYQKVKVTDKKKRKEGHNGCYMNSSYMRSFPFMLKAWHASSRPPPSVSPSGSSPSPSPEQTAGVAGGGPPRR